MIEGNETARAALRARQGKGARYAPRKRHTPTSFSRGGEQLTLQGSSTN
jgi:hypothetical protein